MKNEELFQIQSNTLSAMSGMVLISEPFMNDFYFGRSVILLVDHHDKDGSLGVIINKKLVMPFNDVVNDFPDFEGDIYLGGPVATDRLFYIHTLGELIPESHQICKGIYWGGHLEIVKNMISMGLIHRHEIRFYLGYSGWEREQLKNELTKNSWLVGDIPSKLLMSTRPTSMWATFAKKIGKRYQLWDKFPKDPSEN